MLTPAERARRAAVLGITLPDPPAPTSPPAPAPRPNGKARSPIAGKLTASPALRAKLGLPVTEPPPPQLEPEPSALPVARPSKQERYEQTRERYKQVRKLMASRWPAIFGAARPLAIGIDKQVRVILSEDEINGTDLWTFFRIWTRRAPYRAALARGDRRVNLDGSDAGPAFAAPSEDVPGPD